MTRYWKPLSLALVLIAVLGVLAASPIGSWLALGIGWLQTHPGVAWLAFVGAYIVAALLVVPGSILTLAAGFVFGLPIGVLLVSLGSALGAAAAFLVARFFARNWVAERLESLPRFHALDLATRQEGFTIIFLARLSPLFPFNLLNYGLGATGVSFRDFMLGSWIGMLPVTVAYVYIGTLAKDLAQLTSGRLQHGPLQMALLGLGLVVTIVLTVIVTHKANRALAVHLAAAEQPSVDI